MIIQPDFLTHWKVQALSGAIGRLEALTALLALWGHCQTSKAYVHRFTPEKLAGICQYHGDPDHLLRTFLKLELLDLLESGEFEVHGWAEKNSAFTKNWENGGKGGRPSKNANKNPNPVSGNPKDVWVNPASNESAIWGNPNRVLENRRKEGIEGKERIEGRKEGFGPVGPPTSLIFWNPASGWTGFTPELRQTLKNAYPRVDLDLACVQADLWLRQKPANADKKNWLKFLTNWLSTSSPSGEGSDQGASKKYGQKNEEWLGPPIHLVRPAPTGPWRAAFTATYRRPADIEWAALPDGIQSEIKTILAAADPLQLAAWADLEKNEGSTAA